MKIRAMYLIMLVLAIGLLVSSAPAMASHDKSSSDVNSGHWDNWTVNDTDNVGLKGYLFIPAFLRLDCDERAVHGPPAGFSKSEGPFANGLDHVGAAPIFGNNGGCTQRAWASLSAWTSGGFFDPRGGTAFIPPSGDHHRSGGRMLLQVAFSGGQWLSGFAPALGSFPFYNLIGVPGAGESPEGILRYCQAGLPPFDNIPAPVNGADFNGDGSTGANGGGRAAACEDWAALGAAAIMEFVDHHGSPVTPGRFPRYVPHQRQAWPNTVVTSYTASSQNQGHGISQLFETSQTFIDGSTSSAPVIWYSMSDESAGGCPGGWCAWSYNPVTHTLCKTVNASPGSTDPMAGDGACGGSGATLVVTAAVIDSVGGIGNGGHVVVTHTLNKFEKSPAVIYQKLGQFVEMDTDAAQPNQSFVPGDLTTFTHNEGPGDLEQAGQAVWYEFWGLSGPNFQAEEAQDPYTWMICGSRNSDTGEKDCANEGGGIDSPQLNGTTGAHVLWAIVKPKGVPLGGLDPLQRYGGDLRPTTGDDCTGSDPDPSFCGKADVMVACTPTGGPLTDNPNTAINEATIVTSICESDAGADGAYGTADDGTIYYAEATENGLRAFVRENRAFAFSFINGIGINHPDLCANSVGENQCADSPATGTRQVMYQNTAPDLGATLSCFNCSALGQHTVPSHGFDHYNFKWTPLPGVHIPEDHPGANGQIPEGGGEPSNGF